jgi:hypothetical protein
MALTGYGKDEALAGVIAKMTYVGLFSSAAFAPTAGTAVTASLINMTGAKAKGFTNGKIVVFPEVTGSVTGIVAERPYYVVGETTNGFEVSTEEGGTAVKVAGHELEAASTKAALLTELTGGSYARVKTTWGTPKAGEVNDTSAEAIKVPAASTITYAGWWEGASTGKLMAVAKLENSETYTGEGEYKVSADKLEGSPTVA